MEVPSKIYAVTVLSNDLPDDVLRACAVACGIVLNNYYKSAHMPVAVEGNPNTIFGRSWDICQRVDDWAEYKRLLKSAGRAPRKNS